MTYVHNTPFVAESKEVYKELKLLVLFEQKAQPWAQMAGQADSSHSAPTLVFLTTWFPSLEGKG